MSFPAILCTVSIARGFFDVVSPPSHIELWTTQSAAQCFQIVQKYSAPTGAMPRALMSEDDYRLMCGPDGSACKKF